MRHAVISFTGDGSRLCARLCEALKKQGHAARGYVPQKYIADFPGLERLASSARAWTKEHFAQENGLIFIGAAGVAVRLIAPYLRDKRTDPAVVVLDDQARHVISLLSGHVGGANRLTAEIAALLHADPVITTATDLRGRTAIDVWAADQGLTVTDRELAKQAAQALADGGSIGLLVDEELRPVYGSAVQELFRKEPESYVPWSRRCAVRVRITVRADEPPAAGNGGEEQRWEPVLRLVPRLLCLGIGCRKQTPRGQIAAVVSERMRGCGLDMAAVAAVASIDLKRGEPGLSAFAEKLGVPFLTFSAEELKKVPGVFRESEFVRQVTGVGNVCERAALAAASGLAAEGDCRAVLLMEKQAKDGVTAAAALALPEKRCGAVPRTDSTETV